MTLHLDEKELYPIICNYLHDQGYFVIPGTEKTGIRGTEEFGFTVEGQPVFADIVAAKWDNAHLVETIAVQCKRLETMNSSIGDGIRQAVDYQDTFDRVYIATENNGSPGNKYSVLKSLGIGHLSVDVNSEECAKELESDFRNSSRFDESVRNFEIVPRLALFLAFSNVLGLPLRYGEIRFGGGHIARDIAPDIQFYSWYDNKARKGYFGINIERIPAFRTILLRTNKDDLKKSLSSLKGYTLSLEKEPVPIWKGQNETIIPPTPCRNIDMNQLWKGVTDTLDEVPRKWRPQVIVSKQIIQQQELPSREEYINRIQSTKDELSEVISTLARRS